MTEYKVETFRANRTFAISVNGSLVLRGTYMTGTKFEVRIDGAYNGILPKELNKELVTALVTAEVKGGAKYSYKSTSRELANEGFLFLTEYTTRAGNPFTPEKIAREFAGCNASLDWLNSNYSLGGKYGYERPTAEEIVRAYILYLQGSEGVAE